MGAVAARSEPRPRVRPPDRTAAGSDDSARGQTAGVCRYGRAGQCALPSDFAAYKEVCLRMLESSDALVVLLLDGIRESVGVAAEIDHARKLGIPLNQIKLPGPDASGDAQFEIVHNPRWWR